jgi:hypothetical protein
MPSLLPFILFATTTATVLYPIEKKEKKRQDDE